MNKKAEQLFDYINGEIVNNGNARFYDKPALVKKILATFKEVAKNAFCEGIDTLYLQGTKNELFNKYWKSLTEPEQIKCSECGAYFNKKEIIIKGDEDTCDKCLSPE